MKITTTRVFTGRNLLSNILVGHGTVLRESVNVLQTNKNYVFFVYLYGCSITKRHQQLVVRQLTRIRHLLGIVETIRSYQIKTYKKVCVNFLLLKTYFNIYSLNKFYRNTIKKWDLLYLNSFKMYPITLYRSTRFRTTYKMLVVPPFKFISHFYTNFPSPVGSARQRTSVLLTYIQGNFRESQGIMLLFKGTSHIELIYFYKFLLYYFTFTSLSGKFVIIRDRGLMIARHYSTF